MTDQKEAEDKEAFYRFLEGQQALRAQQQCDEDCPHCGGDLDGVCHHQLQDNEEFVHVDNVLEVAAGMIERHRYG